jgi:hypothetical protein
MDANLKKYKQQAANARHRNIEFKLSYDEWLEIWGDKIDYRGKGKGKYCMARKGDQGAYEIGNVEIMLFEQNNFEQCVYNNKCNLVHIKKKTPSGKDNWRSIGVTVYDKVNDNTLYFDTIKEAARYYKVDYSCLVKSSKINAADSRFIIKRNR